MKIIRMTLGVLSLLSISFTGYARIVTCRLYIQSKNIKIINGNAFEVNIDGIGTMLGNVSHASDISSLSKIM